MSPYMFSNQLKSAPLSPVRYLNPVLLCIVHRSWIEMIFSFQATGLLCCIWEIDKQSLWQPYTSACRREWPLSSCVTAGAVKKAGFSKLGSIVHIWIQRDALWCSVIFFSNSLTWNRCMDPIVFSFARKYSIFVHLIQQRSNFNRIAHLAAIDRIRRSTLIARTWMSGVEQKKAPE